jgi:thioester reductase-like protein
MRLYLKEFGKIFLTILFIMSFSLICGCIQKNESSENISVFQPGNKDSLTYEEMQQLMDNYTSPTPIPESKMEKVVFSKTWFVQNDMDSSPDNVQLTFPREWLDKPEVSDDVPVILLRVPKRLLEMNDINTDPNMITLNFRADRFKEFPNLTAVDLR